MCVVLDGVLMRMHDAHGDRAMHDRYGGKIEMVHAAAGTYDVLFDDGDREANVRPTFVRRKQGAANAQRRARLPQALLSLQSTHAITPPSLLRTMLVIVNVYASERKE